MKSSVIKRSVVIDGHKTSVSLEDPFWTDLKKIAHTQQVTLAELVTKIDGTREQSNLSSAIRLFVLHHYEDKRIPSGVRYRGTRCHLKPVVPASGLERYVKGRITSQAGGGWGPQMNTWDEYRVKAAELSARAVCETNPQIQADLDNLARSYLRLAMQAEQNNRLDLTYETPLSKDDGAVGKSKDDGSAGNR